MQVYFFISFARGSLLGWVCCIWLHLELFVPGCLQLHINFILPQDVNEGSGSNLSNSGLPMTECSKQFIIGSCNVFLQSVFTLLKAENPHSHTDLLIESTIKISATLFILENHSVNSRSCSCMYWQCLKVNHSRSRTLPLHILLSVMHL